MMLDCGLSMQSALNFLPLSFVQSSRIQNLPIWMPNDVTDADLEGVSLLALLKSIRIILFCF